MQWTLVISNFTGPEIIDEIKVVWDNRIWFLKSVKQNQTNILQHLVWLKQLFEFLVLEIKSVNAVDSLYLKLQGTLLFPLR